MTFKEGAIVACWFLSNAVGVGLLAFADAFLLRLLGWAWVSFALSMSGLIVVVGMIPREKDTADQAST